MTSEVMSNSVLSAITREDERILSKDCMQIFRATLIHDSPKLDAAQVSIKREWILKL